MSLAKTLEEIKRIQPYVNEDVETGPRETMAARRGRKVQSIEQMKNYRRSYRLELLESAAFIVVTGSAAKEFATVATEKFGCFSANPLAFYEDLANRIPPTLYQGKESMVNLFDIIGRHLYDKAMELDLNEYNLLTFRQEHYVSVKSKEDLVKLLQSAINAQVGSEIVGIQAVTSLVDKAIETNHAKKVTPIVLTADNEKLALDLENDLRKLKTRGVYLVVAGKGTKTLRAVQGVISVKEPNETNVENALNQIGGSAKEKTNG